MINVKFWSLVMMIILLDQLVHLLGFFLPTCACSVAWVLSDSLWPYGLQPTRLLLSMGFSRQEYWSGLSCSPLGDLPDPKTELTFPVLQADSWPTEPPGKPFFLPTPYQIVYIYQLKKKKHPHYISIPHSH